MIERTHLHIIQEVHRCGTLTEAAINMHLTQSALSHTIKKLEQRTNCKIWEREGRNVTLTPAGLYVLGLAERLLPQLERGDNTLREYADGVRGQLSIGMECHPCYQWLQHIIPPFLATWPKVDLDIKQEFQFGGIQALLNNEIDLIITPDPIVHNKLEFIPVFPYELVLVVSKDHVLSQHQSITAEALLTETLITYPVPIERLDIFNQFLLPANCFPLKHKTMQTIDMILQMVSAKRGVTALPQWLASEYMHHMNLSIIRLGEFGIHKYINIGVLKESQAEYITGFINIAKITSTVLNH